MGSVLDYAWRDFAPVITRDPTLDDLRLLAKEKDPGLFVLHEERTLTSALVIPGLIAHLLRRAELTPDFPAARTGLIDILAEGQVRVDQSLSARVAARMVAPPRAWAGVVVDEKLMPVGIFLPSTLAERIPRASVLSQDVQEAFSETLQKRGFVAALELVESQPVAFHSEAVSYAAPDPLICGGDTDDGPHHVHACPCSRHKRASCGRTHVAGP